MSELRTNKIYPRDGLPAGASGGPGTALYVNRASTDLDSNQYNRTASSITVMEISG